MHASFLRVIYSILNASVLLKRNETNEMCLVRNEMRGGKLPLSGTVTFNALLEAEVGASSSRPSCDVEAILYKADS